jgi:hypothetical protein
VEREERRLRDAEGWLAIDTAQHRWRSHYGVEICVWPGPEGAAVSVLPDERAQRSCTVSDVILEAPLVQTEDAIGDEL